MRNDPFCMEGVVQPKNQKNNCKFLGVGIVHQVIEAMLKGYEGKPEKGYCEQCGIKYYLFNAN